MIRPIRILQRELIQIDCKLTNATLPRFKGNEHVVEICKELYLERDEILEAIEILTKEGKLK